jgi:Arc/MetJ-type ribon-helix-helix transcriptional regulator
VRLGHEQLDELDRLVRSGRFRSRAEAIRAALDLIIRENARREIEQAYRHGYTAHPQAGDDLEWVERAGEATLSELE